MGDTSSLPLGKNARRTRFLGTVGDGATSLNAWQTWELPHAASMVMFYLIGGGGGGGGGRTGTVGTLRGGGAGGGGGKLYRVLMPASMLPQLLYLRTGNGGRGGAANLPGAAASASIISDTNTAGVIGGFTNECFIVSDSPAAAGGAAGVTVGIANGGSAGLGSGPQFSASLIALVSTTPGAQAGKSSTATAGTSVSLTGGSSMFGGPSGGSVTALDVEHDGGSLLLIPWPSPPSTGRTIPGGLAGGGAGGSGLYINRPFLHSPGSGGGGNNTGVGGRGGDGGIGSGGSGGGGGLTGGAGGNGGPGMIEITWW